MKPFLDIDSALKEIQDTLDEQAAQEKATKAREKNAYAFLADGLKQAMKNLEKDGWSVTVDYIYDRANSNEPEKTTGAGEPTRIAEMVRDGKGYLLIFKVFRTVKIASDSVRASVRIDGLKAFTAWARLGFPIRQSEECEGSRNESA